MKKLITAILIIAFIGCQTVTDATGKASKQLTPAAKAVLLSMGDVAAQALANAAVITATQYISTGKLDKNALVAANMQGLASNAQGYVGQILTAAQLAKVTGVPAVAKVAPAQVLITQQTVDSLNAAASVQSLPKP